MWSSLFEVFFLRLGFDDMRACDVYKKLTKRNPLAQTEWIIQACHCGLQPRCMLIFSHDVCCGYSMFISKAWHVTQTAIFIASVTSQICNYMFSTDKHDISPNIVLHCKLQGLPQHRQNRKLLQNLAWFVLCCVNDEIIIVGTPMWCLTQ